MSRRVRRAFLHLGTIAACAVLTSPLAAQESCRDDEWHVSPLGGPHLEASGLVAMPTPDAEAARRRLAQLRGVSGRLGEHRARLERGRADGFTASRDNVLRVLEQLDLLDAQLVQAAESQGSAAGTEAVADSVRALLRGDVRRAVSAYASYLRSDYLADARANGGMVSLPGGAACYRARLVQISAIDTPAESLAALAAGQIAALDAELATVAARLVGPMPLEDAKRTLRRDPRFLHTSREEMLTAARDLERRLTPAVARFFHHPPDVPLVIEPTPAVRERSDAPARYGAPRGPGEPGTFFLNTWQPDSQPRWNLPVAVAHEGAPGHHFERTYPRSVEMPASARSRGIGAYIEGWGMYAEELATRESGVLDDDLSRLERARDGRADASRWVVARGGDRAHDAGDRQVAGRGVGVCRSARGGPGAARQLYAWLPRHPVAARRSRACARCGLRLAGLPRTRARGRSAADAHRRDAPPRVAQRDARSGASARARRWTPSVMSATLRPA
jgi:uncharacterized protein (DUF885 family)